MGFFQGLGKLMAGKPVFDENLDEGPRDDTAELKQEIHQDNGQHKTSFVDQHGNKIMPEVAFRNFKSSRNGPKVTTMAWVRNTSPFEVELIKTEVLGYRQDIRRRLRPNEEHEVKVYEGSTIANDYDHHAKLYYKIHENDDLFLADYSIEYNRESDGTFTLEEFQRTYPPRDI